MSKRIRKLLSIMLIITIVVGSIGNITTKQAKAAVSQVKSTSNYLNISVKYLYLGEKGIDTYNFNVNKDKQKVGATYNWYVRTDKGNPDSVTINKKTGIVTAREAGTAYIRCKITLTDGTILRPEARVTVRNNITEVEISNLPESSTITPGVKYNFNRTVLDTKAGKKQKRRESHDGK